MNDLIKDFKYSATKIAKSLSLQFASGEMDEFYVSNLFSLHL